jgi:hypothetical protein
MNATRFIHLIRQKMEKWLRSPTKQTDGKVAHLTYLTREYEQLKHQCHGKFASRKDKCSQCNINYEESEICRFTWQWLWGLRSSRMRRRVCRCNVSTFQRIMLYPSSTTMITIDEKGTRILRNLDTIVSENIAPHPHDTALLKLWRVKFVIIDTLT